MKGPREIAPRLVSGECRVTIGHGLPPAVKQGLIAIARSERRSLSWVLEQVLIRYFKLEKPEYRKRKRHQQIRLVKRKVG